MNFFNIMQNYLIKILTPISNLSNKIPGNVRKIFFYIFMGCLTMQFWLLNMGILEIRYMFFFGIGCIFLAGAVFFILPNNYKCIDFSKSMVTGFTLLGVFVLISGIVASENQLPNAVLILIALPIIFFVLCNVDMNKYFEMLVNSSNIMFVVFVLISMILEPINQGHQYSSFFTNVNGLAFYLTGVFTTLLFKISLIDKDKYPKIKYFYYALIGIDFSIIFYTNSRTGQYACTLIFIFSILLKIIKHYKVTLKVLRYNVLPVIISVCIFMPLMIHIINFIPTVYGYINKDNTKKNISISSFIAYNELKTGLQDETEDGMQDKNLERYSAGRTTMWKAYLNELNFFGHEPSHTFSVGWKDGVNSTAHMTILQYAYDSGIFAGICFFALNILSGVRSVIYYLKNKDNEYAFLPFIIIIGFGAVSIVASVVSPFRYTVTLLYYLVLPPLFINFNKYEESH